MRSLAPSSFRYRFDDPELYGLSVDSGAPGRSASISWALSQHVRISGAVLPRLQEVLDDVAGLLDFDRPFVGFLYAAPEVNAQCIAEPDGRVLILLSSALVERLSATEVAFVVGHEFAHACFGHYGYPSPTPGSEEPKRLELMRSAEISADRLGLVSCGSADEALRAIMKTASGLGDDHLDIDLVEYLRQGAELRHDPDDTLAWSTHPPLVLRARALLRFEGIWRAATAGDEVGQRLRELDDEVFGELEEAMQSDDGWRVARDAAFWTAVSRACVDGALDAEEREQLGAIFGPDRVEALSATLSGQSRADAQELIDARVAETQQALDAARLGVKRLSDEILASFHAPSAPPRRG